MNSAVSSVPLPVTTSWKLVVPFYVYAAIAFIIGTGMLAGSTAQVGGHFFQPRILAIVHIMALGWGTMIILGASYQLVPVIVEGALYSHRLAQISFLLSAIGIPLLVYGFYEFHMGWPARWGGRLIVLALAAYVVNLYKSISSVRRQNVQAVFIFTASLWLLATASAGLVLVYNFTRPFLSHDSLYYLSLHAHMGIAGWFLLLIVGVGSRLMPMFLISKYENTRLLWWIYGIINGSLIVFVLIFLARLPGFLMAIPLLGIIAAMGCFAGFCRQAYLQRLRRRMEMPMRVSLAGVLIMAALPVILGIACCGGLLHRPGSGVVAYGFCIFFGWITAIILGMTFKTLPFIVWNKVFQRNNGGGRLPNPKDLFHAGVFRTMIIAYALGLLIFLAGLLAGISWLLKSGSILLFGTAVMYGWNVLVILRFKPSANERGNQ